MDVMEAWALTDKMALKTSTYPAAQHRHFSRLQGQPVTVLEIGVLWGGSLQLWRNYFGEQATIVGADIDPKCKAHEGERIHVEIGDQSDPEFLRGLVEKYGPFDVVMDDGGHSMTQQVVTFETLFPLLRDGGVYQCEDTSSSYMVDDLAEFGPRYGEHGTFMELMKAKLDEMHAWFPKDGVPTAFTRSAASMCFYPGIVFIEKDDLVNPQFVIGKGDTIEWRTMERPA